MNFGECVTTIVLHPKICRETPEDVKKMINKIRQYPNFINMDSIQRCGRKIHSTPLISAVSMRHHKCIEVILREGANINGKDLVGFTPLSVAIETENIEIMKYLLEKGASVNYEPDAIKPIPADRTYFLYLCVFKDEAEPLEVLLSRGAITEDPFPSKFMNTPLATAITFKKIRSLKILLLYGAKTDINAMKPFWTLNKDDYDSIIPAHRALLKPEGLKNVKTLQILHEFGANLWERNSQNLTTLDSFKERSEYNENIGDKVEYLMNQPLSLQSCARLSIRNCLGNRYMKAIPQLPLPIPLKSFLAFKDLDEKLKDEVLNAMKMT